MSRSYKKHPICTDGGTPGTKYAKRFAAKRVRNARLDEVPLKGNGYKKLYCSYDIHDYIIRYSLEEARADWESGEYYWYHEDHESFEDYLNHWWARCYKRK